jgi:hypothetical protein
MLSSLNANVRSWSQPCFAYRSIAVVSIFWILFSIHGLFGSIIYYEPGYSYCYIQQGSYKLFVTLYSIIINYLLPPIMMVILGLLTIVNVQQTQRQIHPTGRTVLMQRKDRYLSLMLLFQVLINVSFTIPPGIFQVCFNFAKLINENICLLYRCMDSCQPIGKRMLFGKLEIHFSLLWH